MKNKAMPAPVQIITEVGIMAALGFVIDELQSAISRGLFIAGGSIGFAMVCVIIMCYRRGFLAGLATGLIMSLLDVATGPYILAGAWYKAFLQLLLDYVLAYPVVAVAASFRNPYMKSETRQKKFLFLVLGCVCGGLAKLAIHYLAGILFWADPSNFAWDLTWMNPYLYCFVYNIAYMGPCIVLSIIICALIFWKAPFIYEQPNRLYTMLEGEKE